MIQYYVADTETTGLSSTFHEINQISIIRVADGFQKSWNIAVANPNNASAQALQIQGKTKADLKIGQPIKEVIKEVNEFLEEDGLDEASRCFIGHNVAFDCRFMQAAWEKEKQKLMVDLWLCTKKFMKAYVNKFGDSDIKFKQGEAKVKYGQDKCLIGIGLTPKFGAHSASIDCQNCLTLYNFLMTQGLNHVRIIDNKPHKIKNMQIEYFDDID